MKKYLQFSSIWLLFWIIFIFTRSLQPANLSTLESQWVLDLIQAILPFDVSMHFVRKAAHFTEFAVLGAEIFALLALESLSIGKCGMYTSFSSLFLAFIDETLQIFSKRGPTILDVWIDFLGAACSILLGLIILFLINFFSHRKEKGDTNG